MPERGWSSVAALLLALRCEGLVITQHAQMVSAASRWRTPSGSASPVAAAPSCSSSRWTRPHSLKRARVLIMTYAEGGGQDKEEDLIPDVLSRHPQSPPAGISLEDWAATTAAAQEKWRSSTRLTPNPLMSPDYVAATVLTALRHSNEPYTDHGCEVAIRFSSSTNPASSLTPHQMRRYLSDPALPFYRILAEWDEMDTRGGGLSLSASIDPTSTSTSTNGDAPTADAADSAYQAVLVRRTGDSTWSTVNLQMSREHGCWLIDRLWVDDQSVDPSARAAGGAVSGVDGGVDASVRIADMLADAANEAMGCRFGDYDPVQLVSWLEQDPSEELSPKMVVLNCLCALRAKDIPHRNAGCALTIRFCSPNNAASTLTPAHFAAYLEEPWYQIIAQWSEMAFHSEEMNADGSEADLVVLLKRQGDAEWTSMNWLLGRYDGLWLTERIWVDDV